MPARLVPSFLYITVCPRAHDNRQSLDTGLVAFQIVKYRARVIQRRKAIASTSRSSKNGYSKLPMVADSGVVLNTESSITLRTVAGEDDEDDEYTSGGVYQEEDDDDVGVHAHKAVVGPDELLPGEEAPPPKNGEKMVGFTQALMWLPAIFDVSS
jgi:hypothetical protein